MEARPSGSVQVGEIAAERFSLDRLIKNRVRAWRWIAELRPSPTAALQTLNAV